MEASRDETPPVGLETPSNAADLGILKPSATSETAEISENAEKSEKSENAETAIVKSRESAEISDIQHTGNEPKPRRKKRKPARVQMDPDTVSEHDRPAQTGTVFNIWYQKWSGGDREDKYFSQKKAEGRCNIARDSGYTKGDKIPGSFFCIYFAKGMCVKGKNCEYLHRLPTEFDLFPPTVDCFGRDRFSDYREDMGGVGSFARQNRTLYVGRISVTDDMEEVVSRHFTEWGKIERIRVLRDKGVAFVTYVSEVNAQFAKEAMAHQSLDNDEVLNVRWATVDPNPAAQAREKRRVEQAAAEMIRQLMSPEELAAIEGSVKRQRIEGRRSDGRKAVEGVSRKAIEGVKRDDEGEKEEEEETETANVESQAQGTSLVSAATLAALKAVRTQPIPKPMPKPVEKVESGPLLSGYSDSSEDEA